MARPQKDGMDYFSHDVYASSDEKLEPLILLYGANGYAFYFLHLEYIYRNKELEFDISDAETKEVIQQKLHISDSEYNQILQTALKKNCFDREIYEKTGKLTSDGIKKRAFVVTEKREKMRQKYSRIKENISDAEITQETGAETPQSKVKESKVKESKKDTKVKNEIPFQKIIDLYHINCPSLPKVIKITDKRKTQINARWPLLKNIESFEQYFQKSEASDFLTGRTEPTQGHQDWKCDFDWLLNETNMVKVLEGKYINKASPKIVSLPLKDPELERTNKLIEFYLSCGDTK